MEEKLLNRLKALIPEECIFGILPVITNKIQIVADKSMEEITLKQWLLLIIILQFEDELPTLTQVANAMGSSRQNVKQLALKLEAKGLLKIKKDSKDSRILRLTVSASGKELLEGQNNYGKHFLELLYQDISQQEKVLLANSMLKLLININHMEELVEGGYKI